MTEHTIGVDISKSHLDVFRLEDQAAQRFENSVAGFCALRKWLGKTPVARIVFEPTGPYHKAFDGVGRPGRFPLPWRQAGECEQPLAVPAAYAAAAAVTVRRHPRGCLQPPGTSVAICGGRPCAGA